MNLIAVTACPTGIAHSQMAAENLENTAEELGHEIKVEVEGAMGTENELSSDDIAAADAVIIAADTTVHTDRFDGVPVIKGSVKDAVNDPEDLIHRAVDDAGGEAAESTQADAESGSEGTASTSGALDVAETPTTGDDAAATTDGDAGATTDDETEAATADEDRQTRGRDDADHERQGLVGKIKSLFS